MNPFGWSDDYVRRMIELIGPAVVYDEETLINCFTLSAESIDNNNRFTWEISDRRNDLRSLLEWLEYLRINQIPMISFNGLGFDYPILHMIYMRPDLATYEAIYAKAQAIINGQNEFGNARFGHMIYESDRIIPQIDLYKIHHFDNKAKVQSLKGLEFNMRSASVKDMPVEHGEWIDAIDIDKFLVPYNQWDVSETKRFALISAEAIDFRRQMAKQIKGDVLNFNETKLGKELLAQRLGDEVTHTRNPMTNRREPRQTVRSVIPLRNIIFPYIQFEHPEFQRIHQWMLSQTLTPADLEAEDQRVSTKGVFTGVHADIRGFQFHFGTGGIHGSVSARKYVADDEWAIDDIDVTGLYPSIAIVNRLYPEHLGERFIAEYANLKTERGKYKKGTAQSNALKLAANGTYGDSNNVFSVFYDPQFTMTITINGQLLLCMLAERMMKVPTVEIIQINTDGITYRIHKSMRPIAEHVHREWEAITKLELEFATYSRMWIRDVNNYVAESWKDGKRKLKLKGAYWYPVGADYPDGGWPEAISKAGPSAWYKDLGAQIVQRAAVASMVYGVNPLDYMIAHRDPFDFMHRAKVPRGSNLFIGDRKVQRITRYYIAKQGGPLRKISPPTGTPGEYKRQNGISEYDYQSITREIGPGVWDARIHTKNKSKYEDREISFQAGWLVAECNDASEFRFDNLEYGWYLEASRKLIIG